VPAKVNALVFQGVDKFPCYLFTPTDDIKLKHIIQTFIFRDLISSDFQMKFNIYFDSQGRRKVFESNTINNFDVVRIGDFYCELRFDFPALANLLTIGHQYMVEFELSGTYDYDNDNYLGLIIDHDSPAAIINEGKIVSRLSPFFEVV
jgi:hypothetical protein